MSDKDSNDDFEIEDAEIVSTEEVTEEDSSPEESTEVEISPRSKDPAKSEMTALLDGYLEKTLTKLWTIADDKRHPDHKRHGFEALKLLMKHLAPVRKEQVPQPDPIIIPLSTTNNTINNTENKTLIQNQPNKEDVKQIEVVVEPTEEEKAKIEEEKKIAEEKARELATLEEFNARVASLFHGDTISKLKRK